MGSITLFSKINSWLQTTEMFARPAKQIPGKWFLFEYYIDLENELSNFKEAELKAQKHYLEIDFKENGIFLLTAEIPLSIIQQIENGSWSISRNYIVLIHPNDFKKNVEFQFAVEKGILKLLKKDAFGKIQFFGFFRKN